MSTLAVIIFILSAVIANGISYLCFQSQSLLEKPLPAMPWMICGISIHLNAFFTAQSYLGLFNSSVIYALASALCLSLIFLLAPFVKKYLPFSEHN